DWAGHGPRAEPRGAAGAHRRLRARRGRARRARADGAAPDGVPALPRRGGRVPGGGGVPRPQRSHRAGRPLGPRLGGDGRDASATGAKAAEVVLRPDGTGFLVKDRLAPLSPDRTYQLWMLVDGKAISAGVLGPNPGIVPFKAAGDPAGFAISNEVRGGATQPS